MIWREKEEAAKDSGSPSVVRQAQKGDLDIMTEIQAEAFGDTPEMARRYVESSYQSGDTMLFVIETQGRCTGCCCVDTSGERAMIFGLCVAADFRGKGLGGQLLRESVKKRQIRREKCPCVWRRKTRTPCICMKAAVSGRRRSIGISGVLWRL